MAFSVLCCKSWVSKNKDLRSLVIYITDDTAQNQFSISEKIKVHKEFVFHYDIYGFTISSDLKSSKEPNYQYDDGQYNRELSR